MIQGMRIFLCKQINLNWSGVYSVFSVAVLYLKKKKDFLRSSAYEYYIFHLSMYTLL